MSNVLDKRNKIEAFDSQSLTRDDINNVQEVRGNRSDGELWGMTKINLPNGLVIHIRNDNGYGDTEGVNCESTTQIYVEDVKNGKTINLASISQEEFYGDRGELHNEVTIRSQVGRVTDGLSFIYIDEKEPKMKENK